MEPQANFNGNGRAFKKVVEGVSVFSLHYKGHVCINKRRVKKKKKKKVAPEVKGAALAVITRTPRL